MFLGKWSFGQATTCVVVDPQSAALRVADAPTDGNDRLNAYGTASAFTLQSSIDGRFITRVDTAYSATTTRDGTPHYFAVSEPDSDGQRHIIDLGAKPGGDAQAVWNVADGAVVAGDAKMPPASATFTRQVVTVGLATIQSDGITDNPDLTWVDLHGADLSKAGLVDLTKSVLNHADLSGATLPRGVGFQGSTAQSLDLRETKAPEAILAQTDLRKARLDGAQLKGVDLESSDLSGASLRGADLTECTNLARSVFNGADLTGAKLKDARNIVDTSFVDAKLVGVDFGEASVTGRMDLSGADLSGATLSNAADRISIYPENLVITRSTRFVKAVIRHLDLTGYDLSGINFSGADLTGCLLDRTKLSSANFGYAVLDGTSVTGGVGMHGTNFSSASLRGADLTGAQLGAVGQLFRIGSDQQGYEQFLEALRKTDAGGVGKVFAANGHALTPPVAVQPSTFRPDAEWVVQAGSGQFRVFLETVGERSTLGVYQPTSPAVLTNAFLVNVNLKGANLYGVRASGAQLYATAGKSVNLNRAKIDGLQANNANLGHIDLSQATLAGVNFDYAVLTGADFTGATIAVDGSGGQPSFNGANLQGANFTSATLHEVILANAAVAVADPADPAASAGVWLFSLMPEQASTVMPELKAATESFSMPAGLVGFMGSTGPVPNPVVKGFAKAGIELSERALLAALTTDLFWTVTGASGSWVVFRTVDDDYRPALGVAEGTAYTLEASFYLPLSLQSSLGSGPLSARVAQAFADAGHPLKDATSVTDFHPNTWQVIDGGTSYTLGIAFVSSAQGVDVKVVVRPSMATCISAFGSAGVAVSTQAVVTAIRTGGWRIDNDAENPFNGTRGYIEFVALPTADGGLDVYGSTIRIVRSSAQGQHEFVNVPCQTTALPRSVLGAGDNSICPNGASVSANVSGGLPFDQWCRARFLASPPACIPDPQGQFYCPT